jgi:serine/threonine-protein kinase
MSPEQINGQPTDERSDLYSLGISLYEMLTGERPFKGDSDFNIMVAHLTKEPTPPVQLHPGLPEVVNALVLKSIAKAPGDRFQSANEFRRAVQAAIETAEVHAGKAQVQVAPNTSLVGTLPSMKAHSAAAAQEERTLVQGSRDDTTSGIAAMAQAAAAAKSKTSVVVAPAVQSASVTSPQPSGSRGLYMALGALVVIVVLAAAGIYLPLRKKAAAAPEPVEHNIPTQQSSQSAPQVSPLGQPVVNEQKPAEALQPTGNPKSPVSRAKKLVAQNASSNAASSTPDEAAPPQPSQAEVDALEHEIDQLSARAAAVNNSLDNFQRSSGFGLRGDMVSKQASMKLNLAKAEDAVSRGDLERAKRYQGLAESDVEALEKFLGR